MLSTVLFVAVIGGSFLHVESSQAFKCDNTIIEKIKNSWNGKTPNDILEKAISYDKLLLKAGTSGYLNDEYKGLYSYFTKEDGNVFTTQTLYRIPTDGSEASKLELQVIEAGGAIKDKDTKKKRYPVYSDNGIIACYSCYEDDKAEEGTPAGFVFVKDSGYSTEEYKSALSKLEEVGVTCDVEYSYE